MAVSLNHLLKATLVASIIGTGLHSRTAQAEYMQAYSGNHRARLEADPNLDSTLNFAVIENPGRPRDRISRPTDGFGSLLETEFIKGSLGRGESADFDADARFLYLYQVVNDGHGNAPLGSFDLSVPNAAAITSFGSWNLVLADDDGPVSGLGRDRDRRPLGTNAFGRDVTKYVSSAPANLGVDDPSVWRPVEDLISASVLLDGNSLTINGGAIAAGRTVSLVGFTSNVAPEMFDPANCSAAYLCGAHPIPVPEPSATMLAMIGMLAFVCGRSTLFRN